jgi:putative hydrolase of the HAD superfamily
VAGRRIATIARMSDAPTSPNQSTAVGLKAVLWDFGGVILSSPFEAFNGYERRHGLPPDFIRGVNATNPLTNAWAQLERSDISPTHFDAAFADESEALGHRVPGADVLALLSGQVRPEMVRALDRVIEAGYRTACLTNNVSGEHSSAERAETIRAIMARFEHVVESSKVGCRKPEPRFYEIACELLGVTPHECVFLDDLGINLKPAAAMGMRTIKVLDPADALASLSAILDLDLA